jgi:hypothetical protein
MTYPYIVQGNNITIVIGTTPHTISRSHVTYNKVLAAIKANDWDTVLNIIEPKKAIINFGKGNVSIEGNKIFWKDREMHGALTQRLVQMIQEDFPIAPLVAFMENLMENPSKRAVTELYGFLEKNTLPITPDGHFLAYKKIKQDYPDCYTGKIDNSVGQVVEMERNEVDDDQNRTCSAGLHFCSRDYLSHFSGDRIVVLKINPRDVVSIPTDYNNSKGRACRYEVVDEIDKDKADEAFTKSVQVAAEREASLLTPDEAKIVADIYTAIRAARKETEEAVTPTNAGKG